MLARMTMSAITTISSMSVNPLTFELRTFERCALPITVLGSIKGGAVALGIHVEHVLAAPRRRVRLVLIRTQPPFVVVRHDSDDSRVGGAAARAGHGTTAA